MTHVPVHLKRTPASLNRRSWRTLAAGLTLATAAGLAGPASAATDPAAAPAAPQGYPQGGFDSDSLAAKSAAAANYQPVTRAEVMRRAKRWYDMHLPYDQNDDIEGYRKDCSGLVSMAWGLENWLNTETLPQHAEQITKNELQPGDAINWDNPQGDGHVVLFEKWLNAERTSYKAYEYVGGDTKALLHSTLPYPYYASRPGPWVPLRAPNIVETPVAADDDGLSAVKYGKTVWIYGQSGNGIKRRAYNPRTGKFGGSWKKFAGFSAEGTPDAGTWRNGTLEIVAASNEPGVLHRRTRKNGKWLKQSNFKLPSDLQFAPTLVSLGQGKWRIFYVDTRDRLMSNVYANKHWGKWNSLGGGFEGAAQAIAKDGKLTVFVPRAKHLIRKKTLNLATNKWTGWSGLKTTFKLAQGSSLGATFRPNGQIVLAVRGSNNHLYKATRTKSGWSRFGDLGRYGATNLGGAPEVTAPDNKNLLILGRTNEGIPSYTKWTRRGWTTWKTIR